MQATTGTNGAIWFNVLIVIATAVVGAISPDMLAQILTPKFAMFAVPIIAGLNWLLHWLTGNSSTSALPGVPVIAAATATTATK